MRGEGILWAWQSVQPLTKAGREANVCVDVSAPYGLPESLRLPPDWALCGAPARSTINLMRC